jgi:hypothetical protein
MPPVVVLPPSPLSAAEVARLKWFEGEASLITKTEGGMNEMGGEDNR